MRPTIVTLTFLLFLSPMASIAEGPEMIPAFRSTGAFIALSVPDLEASRTWYIEKLGLAVIAEPPPYQGVSALVLEGGGLTVELIHSPTAQPVPGAGNPTERHGFFKAGIVVGDLDHTLARFQARGIPIAMGPFLAQDGQPANFAIRDNSGNLLQFLGH